jgi:hypothetical protein
VLFRSRATWWGTALAPALWLGLTVTLQADEGSPALRRLRGLFWGIAGLALATGVGFAVAGSAGDGVLTWSASTPATTAPPVGLGRARWWVPPGPTFLAFQAYVVGCLSLAAGLLLVLWWRSVPGTPLRARFGAFLGSAVMFIAFGLYFVAATNGTLAPPPLAGELLIIAGMVILGWNVARYGALLLGEVVTGDVIAFCLRSFLLIGLYGLILAALARGGGLDAAWALSLLLLVVATHAAAEWQGPVVDRLLYGPVAARLRRQLRALSTRAGRQPDPLAALADVRESVDALVRAEGKHIRPAESAPAGPSTAPGPVDRGGGGGDDGDGEAAGATTEPATGSASRGVPPPTELRVLIEGALRHLKDRKSVV